MPIRRTNQRTHAARSEEGWAERRPTRGPRKEERDGTDICGGRERGKKPRTKKKRFLVWYLRPFTVLGQGSLQSQLRFEACCAMRRARNRGPRLIKRRRAIVNDTPRLVVKDRGISKRVTAVTPPRSIDRNRLRGEARLHVHARTHVLYKARLTTRRR